MRSFDTLRDVASAASSPPTLTRVRRGQLAYRQGFVLGVSSELLLIERLSDRIDLDGFLALRLRDVTSLDIDFPRKDFYVKALSLKKLAPTVPSGIDLSNMRSLIRSVGERYPLVVIDRELVADGECEIGHIKVASESSYALRWLSPDATWQEDAKRYKYSDITQVGFGGEYETTLALVAEANDSAR